MSNTGVYYIATGEQFVQEAEMSARSVRDAMPDIPLAIATDVTPNFEFDHTINISKPKHGFADQIDNLYRSPFDKTIHFDTDIYVDSDITDLADLLNQFDIGAAHNHNREAYDPPGVPDSFPEYNTGVVIYRNNEEFRSFTHEWKENYTELVAENNMQNQPSFRKTLYESELRIATLTPEYNCMVRYPGHIKNNIKIAHSRLLDIQTPGAPKSVNVEKSIKILNKYKGHRLYVPDGENGVSVLFGRLPKEAPIQKKAINSIRTDGIIFTVKQGIPFLLNRLQDNTE
jgi:hypothetical protein